MGVGAGRHGTHRRARRIFKAPQTVTVQSRLTQLGIALPEVAAPVGAYTPARRAGDLVYTSGQLPFVDGALIATGIVGEGPGAVNVEQAAEAAKVAVLNALAATADAAGGIDQVRAIIKLTAFVASAPDFTNQPAVINGASGLLVDVFGAHGRHARSAVGVAVLPLGAPVEIELIAQVRAAD